jgi:hypothetical protein
MAERSSILIIALILSSLGICAQTQKKELSAPPPRVSPPRVVAAAPVFNAWSFRQELPTIARPAGVASDHYIQGLGFVCKKEWAIEKSTGVPFRFRLGSLEYTDRLEGKTKNR